jgi:mannose-6-phosphate isomerase-like protein (cupin superfamily)
VGATVTDTERKTIEILVAHENVVITRTRYAAHEPGPELHVHRQHVDSFYILDGALTLNRPAGDRVLEAGEFASVPSNVVHGFRNGSSEELHFLNFHAPGMGFEHYLRGEKPDFDQHSPPDDGGADPSTVVAGAGEPITERPSLLVALLVDLPEIAVSLSRSERGGPSPPLHVHRRHSECFYVLEGEMTFTVGDRVIDATAGAGVHVPPSTPHTFTRGPGDVRFLSVHTPSCGWGDYLRALHKARTDDDRARARAAFDQESV